MLLVDSVGDLRGLAKKVEFLSHCTFTSASFCATTKGVIVKVISGFFELITKTIVGVVKVESEMMMLALAQYSRLASTDISSSLS